MVIRFRKAPILLAVALSAPTWAAAAESAPAVTKVEPARAARGGSTALKVTGKNFAPGAKVAFANPGIRVLSTTFKKSSELSVAIQVSPNAPTGATSLFVVNPDEGEVETAFEVTEAARAAKAVQFDVLNLGDVAGILAAPGKASGTIAYTAGRLVYTEAGRQVFAVPSSDVREIAPNMILGLNTGSFHVILRSGQTYNFVAPSLRPSDSQAIVEALVRALH